MKPEIEIVDGQQQHIVDGERINWVVLRQPQIGQEQLVTANESGRST